MHIARELIDPDADKVVRRLSRHGFQAYLVGGCVRDLLLSRTPKDFDVATSATPKEIRQLFRNCRIIGRRFRLAHIFFGSKIIETSTFRANPREGDDVDDTDELLIKRDNVFGTDTEDARRRDFTINGLFYDVEAEKVIDHVGGLADLERRVVRTIGDPDIRFREDPVRMLRAVKFAARLGLEIEPQTLAALVQHRGEIAKCAQPRVLEEIYRLLRGGAARRSVELLIDTGLAGVMSPQLSALFGPVPEGAAGQEPARADSDAALPDDAAAAPVDDAGRPASREPGQATGGAEFEAAAGPRQPAPRQPAPEAAGSQAARRPRPGAARTRRRRPRRGAGSARRRLRGRLCGQRPHAARPRLVRSRPATPGPASQGRRRQGQRRRGRRRGRRGRARLGRGRRHRGQRRRAPRRSRRRRQWCLRWLRRRTRCRGAPGPAGRRPRRAHLHPVAR